jgi:glutamate racemase
MATPMTLREEKFMALMHAYEDAATIIPLPCPGLVEYVERGEISGSDIEAFLSELFAPYTSEGIDAVVLGCTHYPFVKDAVRNVLGERTLIFDGGAGTARETLRRLTESDLLNPQEAHGTVTLMNSDSSPALAALAGKLLNCEV